jgi:myo-inositol-1(or 4)-monophosphatase
MKSDGRGERDRMDDSPDPRIPELAAACVAAAEAGARVLRELFDQPRHVMLKGRIDLVTDADGAAEARVLEVLRERAPGVAVLAEESGAHAGTGAASAGGARFIVDPLDGTTNYAHGIPLFACTVGVELEGRVVAGCTVDPSRGERFRAVRGGGAFLGPAFAEVPSGAGASEGKGGERRLRVAETRELGNAVVCTGFPYDRGEDLAAMLAAFAKFTAACRGTRRMGSSALDLAYVAAGRLDGFYEMNLKPWDVAAGWLMVEEAFGLVTRYDGAPHRIDGGELLASNPALAPLLRAVLHEAGAGRPSASTGAR